MFTPPSSFALRRSALFLIPALAFLTALTDWPVNYFGLSSFWRDHALVAGALVSLLLLSSGYVVFDVRLEHAREARDEACIDEIRRGILHDHVMFWGKYGDLGPTSMRRLVLFEDVQDARESALATQSTLAVWAQLAMNLQSRDGMQMAKNAVRTFGALGVFIAALEQANIRLGMEDQSRSPEKSNWVDESLQAVHDAHTEACRSYRELLHAAGGESPLKQVDEAAIPI